VVVVKQALNCDVHLARIDIRRDAMKKGVLQGNACGVFACTRNNSAHCSLLRTARPHARADKALHGTVGKRSSCMLFGLATGQSSAQTMSESDDAIQIGVVSDTDNIGSDVCASASTSKPGRIPWQPKSKQRQKSQPAVLGTWINAYIVLGIMRPATEQVNKGRGANRACKENVVFYHRHRSPVDADKYPGDLAKSYELRKRQFDDNSMMGCNHCDWQHKYNSSTHFSDHLLSGCPAFRECAAWKSQDVQDSEKKKKIHKNVRSCFTVVTCLTECGSAEDDRLSQTSLSVVQFEIPSSKFPNRCRPKNVNSRV
jgi:hypothetical protein